MNSKEVRAAQTILKFLFSIRKWPSGEFSSWYSSYLQRQDSSLFQRINSSLTCLGITCISRIIWYRVRCTGLYLRHGATLPLESLNVVRLQRFKIQILLDRTALCNDIKGQILYYV